jgi:Xaa-Pro aminopeptidase
MSLTAETALFDLENQTPSAAAASDRRSDIEWKQTRVAALLQEFGCDGLLVRQPEDFAWLTSGAMARGVLSEAELPLAYFSADQRWLIASNVDSQRLFDEELDGLGFQLKEWPWHWGREQLLADLSFGRKIASDFPGESFTPVGDRLQRWRRALSPYELACYNALGSILSHALEATCRTMPVQQTERETAGQISHRLLHRGVQPLNISVVADGRSRRYRRGGFTSAPITRYAVLTASARKYGLCATVSRSVHFGEIDPTFRREHDAACKVSATYLASSWPDALPRQILATGQHVYRLTGFEHEWRLSPQGYVTGRCPAESILLASGEDLLLANWAVTWQASAGAASSCDTVVITEQGPRLITRAELWPLKRIRVQGAEFFRPDVLVR